MPDFSNPASAPDTLLPHTAVTGGPAWKAAADAGWDMTLIADLMRLTVWERLQQHRSALALATTLREAMKKQNA
jgi:hypothetical protein